VFADSCHSDLLGPSIVHQPKENHEDWVYVYVNMWVFSKVLHQIILLTIQFRWVDQDMFMCFCGGVIGHKILQDMEQQLNEMDPWVDTKEDLDGVMGDGAAAVPVDSDDNGNEEEEEEEEEEINDGGSENEHIRYDEDDGLSAEDGEVPDYIMQEDQYDDL
jgi:hypothetical protein